MVAALTIAACSSSGATPKTGTTKSVSLKQAVSNTLAAPNYTELLAESTPQGKQNVHLKYQAPDRLGGYVESGSKRTYIYVIGTTQYQSQTVPNNASTRQLTFQSQAGEGVSSLDPAHGYLPYATQAKNTKHLGDTYSFTLTMQGQSGTFTYTVNGRYLSAFTLKAPNGSVRLDVSAVGTTRPVVLPTGAGH